MPPQVIFAPARAGPTEGWVSAPKSWFYLLFVVLVAASLAVWWTPLRLTFALALSDERYTHILLILPVSAGLIYVDWKSEWNSSIRPSVIAAGCLIIAVFANAVLKFRNPYPPDVHLAANMLALVACWSASFALCFGASAFRRAIFPLAFLLWMVPLPEFVLDRIVSLLQLGSAAAAHLLFLAARIQVAQRGLLIHIPGL